MGNGRRRRKKNHKVVNFETCDVDRGLFSWSRLRAPSRDPCVVSLVTAVSNQPAIKTCVARGRRDQLACVSCLNCWSCASQLESRAVCKFPRGNTAMTGSSRAAAWLLPALEESSSKSNLTVKSIIAICYNLVQFAMWVSVLVALVNAARVHGESSAAHWHATAWLGCHARARTHFACGRGALIQSLVRAHVTHTLRPTETTVLSECLLVMIFFVATQPSCCSACTRTSSIAATQPHNYDRQLHRRSGIVN